MEKIISTFAQGVKKTAGLDESSEENFDTFLAMTRKDLIDCIDSIISQIEQINPTVAIEQVSHYWLESL